MPSMASMVKGQTYGISNAPHDLQQKKNTSSPGVLLSNVRVSNKKLHVRIDIDIQCHEENILLLNIINYWIKNLSEKQNTGYFFVANYVRPRITLR